VRLVMAETTARGLPRRPMFHTMPPLGDSCRLDYQVTAARVLASDVWAPRAIPPDYQR